MLAHMHTLTQAGYQVHPHGVDWERLAFLRGMTVASRSGSCLGGLGAASEHLLIVVSELREDSSLVHEHVKGP